MKFFILASLLVVAISASLEENAAIFQSFKLEHGKIYSNQVEETKRFSIFRSNLAEIEEHNALFAQGLVTYSKAVNKFTDLTPEEFSAQYLTLRKSPTFNNTVKYVKKGLAVPASVDWRTSGQVTGVKDQGNCGACWAFSITGSTEAAYFRKTGQLVSFSEQQLIDCANVDDGCNGGYLDWTFSDYVEKYGLVSEESYPYQAITGQTCNYDSSQVVTNVDSYVAVSNDESALLDAVATVGPISIAMEAQFLSSYNSGIYSEPRCTPLELDHAVLAVGYGTENGQDYWLVKNSWGSDWGEQGYFKIVRGTNMCGVAEDDVYPIIN